MNTLTAYGHSWVQGDGASRPERCFVDIAARRLHLVPVNLGVGGSSTADVIDLLRRDPPAAARVYLVMTGLNDARLHGGSLGALEAYAADVRTILGALCAAHPAGVVVALEQPYLLDYSQHAPHHHGSHEALDAYNQRLHEITEELACVVLAVAPDWNARTMLAADTVHPNDVGHAALADAVVHAVMASTRPVHDWGTAPRP